MDIKLCRVCGAKKPATEQFFQRSKVVAGKTYYRSVCKECLLRYGAVKAYYSEPAIQKPDGYTETCEPIYNMEHFVSALVTLSRNDIERLESITEKKFNEKTGSSHFMRECDVQFAEIKKAAREELISRGCANPKDMLLDKGLYLIVGDSHGKWTKRPMFDLLQPIVDKLGIKQIIHLGHMVDDDDDISYLWNKFNMIIVSKPEELRKIHEYKERNNNNWKIIRERVIAGGITICNQELISDYVKTPLKSIDSQIFEGTTICNLHRQERAARCSSAALEYIAAPGSLCEPHIVKTIRQIDFTSGYQVKQAYPEGFSKYRRASQLSRIWNQGLILLKVFRKNTMPYMLQTQIHTLNNGKKACAIFDQIFAGAKAVKPDRKIFVVADTHAPEMDARVLDVQKQIAQRFKGDTLIDLGDAVSFGSLNHHAMARNEIADYAARDVMEECAAAHVVLKDRANWVAWNEKYLLFANHERFCSDFVKKNPQLTSLLDVSKLLAVKSAGYHMLKHKSVLRLGPFMFVHGDFNLYGESGRLSDKLTKAFNVKNRMAIVFGHIHSSGIRYRAHSVPMSGQIDQLYNETEASYWNQGCALCTSYSNCAFVQLLDCIDGRTWYKDELLSGGSLSNLKLPKKVTFDIVYKDSLEKKANTPWKPKRFKPWE